MESFRDRLPGYLATALMAVATGLWAFWGFTEMYYEGWGQPGLEPAAYLIPALGFLALWVLAEASPRLGGWLLVVLGALFTAWVLAIQIGRGSLTLTGLLSWFPVTVLAVIIGALFIVEGRHRRRRDRADLPGVPGQSRLRLLIPPATVVLVGLVSTAMNWHVFSRVDDGDRGARLIEGNAVALVWAPAGPGWARSTPDAPGNLSWDEIALYGLEPVGFGEKPGRHGHATREEMQTYGLFRYLADDGVTLAADPQDIWRMPTVDEIVRSLVRDGRHAGCSWQPGTRRADCTVRPDKESPLWATDIPFIYLWAAEAHDTARAYYVGYSGAVGHQPKSWGNPRHGHRFVREPAR